MPLVGPVAICGVPVAAIVEPHATELEPFRLAVLADVPGLELVPVLAPDAFGPMGPVGLPPDPSDTLVPALGASEVFGLVGPVAVPAEPPAGDVRTTPTPKGAWFRLKAHAL